MRVVITTVSMSDCKVKRVGSVSDCVEASVNGVRSCVIGYHSVMVTTSKNRSK